MPPAPEPSVGPPVGLPVEPGGEAMVRAMCAQVDAGDAVGFGAWFDDDATYRFANAEPVVGRAAIVAATAGAAAAMPGVSHHVDQVAPHGSQLFCRFTISVPRADGVVVAMPCVTVIDSADGRIVDYRVHMDVSPVL